MNHTQTEMGFEWVEIMIGMEERMASFDAVSGDKTVYYFAYGDTSPTQHAEVSCVLNRKLRTEHLNDLKRMQSAAGRIEIFIAAKSLQYFGKDQVANEDGLFTQEPVEEISLRIGRAVEIVNPDGGINQDHCPVLVAVGLDFLPR
jgi:hypothetical protein